MIHDRYLEWEQWQWALAVAWFGSAYGWTPMPTPEGAQRVMSGWFNRRQDEPAKPQLAITEFRGHEKPTLPSSMLWARKLWWKAISESWRGPATLRSVR